MNTGVNRGFVPAVVAPALTVSSPAARRARSSFFNGFFPCCAGYRWSELDHRKAVVLEGLIISRQTGRCTTAGAWMKRWAANYALLGCLSCIVQS